MTQLNDKSGNGNHLTPDGGTGPTLLEVNGANWLDFESSTPTRLLGANADINPGSGDIFAVFVFKTATSARQGLLGKIPGTAHFGVYVAFSNSRSLTWRMRDTSAPNLLNAEHDNAGTDYTDDTPRIAGFSYDDSEADAHLYGGANDPTTAVYSNLVYSSGSISPTGNFYLGSWQGGETLDGQIAEVIFFDTIPGSSERSELWDYLQEKWPGT